MAKQKQFTADEMRGMAAEAEVIEVADQFYGHDMDTIAAMLRQAADAMEREEKRERRYEYGLKDEGGFVSRYHSHTPHAAHVLKTKAETVVRREVGEWEELSDVRQ